MSDQQISMDELSGFYGLGKAMATVSDEIGKLQLSLNQANKELRAVKGELNKAREKIKKFEEERKVETNVTIPEKENGSKTNKT